MLSHRQTAAEKLSVTNLSKSQVKKGMQYSTLLLLSHNLTWF